MSDVVGDLPGALGRWLAARIGVPEVQVLDLVAPSATGMSNETTLYTARWNEGGPDREVRREVRHVLRRGAPGHGVFREYDLSVQYRCIQLAASYGVPVPVVLGHEDDPAVLGEPFYVMEHVDGLIPSDMPPYPSQGWVHDADPAAQRRLFLSALNVLAAIHAIDWEPAGFGFLDGRAGGRGSALAWQVADQRAYLEWAADGRLADYPELSAALDWLEERLPDVLELEGPTVLNWGDARISNMIFRDYHPVAVLDWEMATLGPREVDVAWFMYMDRWLSEVTGGPRLPGFPPPADAVAHYEATSGTKLTDLEWYEAFAAFRFGIHLTRIAQRLTIDGTFPADTGWHRNNGAVRSLCRLLGLAEPPGEPGLLG